MFGRENYSGGSVLCCSYKNITKFAALQTSEIEFLVFFFKN